MQIFCSFWWHVRIALRFALWDSTRGRKGLRMVPCHICHIYGVGDAEKSSVGVAMQVTKGGLFLFHREGKFSLCNTAVL